MESQDKHIVALARRFSDDHKDSKVFIVSEDYGMSIRCQGMGVETQELNESDRLENPGDEKDKKLKQLQQELAHLKNRMPKLIVCPALVGGTPMTDKKFQVKLSDAWIEVDAKTEIEKQRKLYPKHKEKLENKSPGYPLVGGGFISSFVTDEQWRAYDEKLEAYFASYDIYVNQLNLWGNAKSRIFCFDLWLMNEGNCPATDIDIFVEFPLQITWIEEANSKGADILQRVTPG